MIVVCRVSTACNLRCPFCAYDKTLSFPRRHIDEACVEHLGALLADYQRLSSDPVLLSWIGGEPLLWPSLFPLSQRFKSDYGLALSATTNGTTLHKAEVRENILANFSELTISVDGFAPLHNSLRGWRNGWQRLFASLECLAREIHQSQAPLKLRANIVLMRDNAAEFPALCKALADVGINEITYNQLGGRDRPEFFPQHKLRIEDIRQLRGQLHELRRQLSDRNVRLCGDDEYWRRIDASARDEAIAGNHCEFGKTFLFVDEFGRVAPCNFTLEEVGIDLTTLRDGYALGALPATFRKQSMRDRERHQNIISTNAATPNEIVDGAISSHCCNCPSTQVFSKFAYA